MFMLLNEIKSTIPWEWTDFSDATQEATFTTPSGNTYDVQFAYYQYSDEVSPKMQKYLRQLGNAFEVTFAFRRDERGPKEFGQTNFNESRYVIAAVKAIVEEFVQAQNPDAIFFSSKQAEASRVSLYQMFVKQLAKKGWKIDKIPIDNRIVFVAIRQ